MGNILLAAIVTGLTAGVGALIGAGLAWTVRRMRRHEKLPSWPVALLVILGIVAGRPATLAAERYLAMADTPVEIARMFDELEEARPSFALLRRDHPDFYDHLRTSLTQEWENGATKEEIGLSVQRTVGSYYRRMLVSADEALIAEYVDLMVETAKALKKASPATCVDFYFGAGANIQPYLSEELVARDAALVSATLSEDPADDPEIATEQEFQSALVRAFETTAERRGRPVDKLVRQFSGGGSKTMQCDAFIGVYESIAAMPASERTPFVRHLLKNMSGGV